MSPFQTMYIGVGIFVFLCCLMLLRYITLSASKRRADEDSNLEPPGVPEQFWRDRCVTRVNSYG